MIFSSSIFLLYFFPVFFFFYFLADKKYKNWIILIGSLIFYAWGAPIFVFVVSGSVFVDFYLVKWMHESKDSRRRKQLLALSISINVGLLLYFKYANFFIENVNAVLSGLGTGAVTWTEVGLPIGISFFTFQTLTYSIDVYRGIHAPLKRVRDYLLYILLFPQMIAGPIVRFNTIADQITNREHLETIDHKLNGFFRFVIGLAKKVLIANVMGEHSQAIFALTGDDLTTPLAWLGATLYAFHIYFDFSGYSDMAIGMGTMMGFKFPENFNNPYVSQSITEFWRRWHITLGAWMKDYLYIPLGGSKVSSTTRLYFNLWVVFLISGLWHGASWNFVIWGAFHGTFLILDRLFLSKFLKAIGKAPAIAFTFVITLIGWVIFNSSTMAEAGHFLGKMFAFDFHSHHHWMGREAWFIFLLATIFSFWAAFPKLEKIQTAFFDSKFKLSGYAYMTITSIVLIILSLSSVITSGFNPFIYFRF